MRVLFCYLMGLLWLSCNSHERPTTSEPDATAPIVEQRHALDGIWGLTHYFDSIAAHKTIAKYRLQAPTWFGILLKIEGDSLVGYGSLVEMTQQLDLASDTLAAINSYGYGGSWFLIQQDSVLLLKQQQPSPMPDSTVYIYRKRQDLAFMLRNMDQVHKISSNITQYFNQTLLAGSYLDLFSKKQIIFHPDGNIEGVKKYTNYNVRNYFGTLHLFGNLDVLMLYNEDTSIPKYYHWQLDGDRLTLTEFVPETITHNGKKTITDSYTLGTQKIRLQQLDTFPSVSK